MENSISAKTLRGKNVIITGASRGLGRMIADAMWDDGANLLLVARSEGPLVELQDRLSASHMERQSVHVFVADLRAPLAPLNILAEARRIWSRLDVLINNAGVIGPIGILTDNDWGEWQETLQVDLLAPAELCKLSISWMQELGRSGSIVNLSGGGATTPRPCFSAYATAKCALVRFSETIAAEVVDLGIRVNCIAPGAVNTVMLRDLLKAGPERIGFGEYQKIARAIENETSGLHPAAELAVYLASDRSLGVTGKIISAVWDSWRILHEHLEDLKTTDIYTLRRIVPEDRGKDWTSVC